MVEGAMIVRAVESGKEHGGSSGTVKVLVISEATRMAVEKSRLVEAKTALCGGGGREKDESVIQIKRHIRQSIAPSPRPSSTDLPASPRPNIVQAA